MIAYLPIYDHGRKTAAINSATSRRLPHGSIVQHGTVYHCDGYLYRTQDAAAAWWYREQRITDALKITADAFYSMAGR